jgi:hypothetical protein
MATWKKVLTEEAIATSTSLGTSNDLVPSQNAVKSYVDTEVGGISVTTTLADLTDTTITSVGDHDIIAYDSASSKYINMTASEAGLQTDLTFDNSPTDSSLNPVTSDGIHDALDGKEDTITGAATTITGSDLTVSRALISNVSGKVQVSVVTAAELSYLDGASSNLQQQIDNKADTNGDSTENFEADDLTVHGDLTVTGTIDTVSQTNTSIIDKTITLAEGANSETNANGSGIKLDTNQTNRIPSILWFNESNPPNTAGCIGNGWKMQATNEDSTKYHIMGFKTGSGAPSSGSTTASTKAEGEGSFYYDTASNHMYICVGSNSSNSIP